MTILVQPEEEYSRIEVLFFSTRISPNAVIVVFRSVGLRSVPVTVSAFGRDL